MGLIAGVVAGVATAATATTAAGVVAGVAAAGASAYGMYQQGKAKDAMRNAAANGAYGGMPFYEPVTYDPLYESDPGYAGIARDTIQGNIRNFPLIKDLVQGTNDLNEQEYRGRVTGFYPGFEGDFARQQQNTGNFLRGQLPYDDVRSIIGNTTERQALLGNMNAAPQVAADLGLTQLDLMQRGQQALGFNAGLLETIYPVGAVETPAKSYLYPNQTVPLAVGENQFNYQADSAERLLKMQIETAPNPEAVAQLNMAALEAGIARGGGGAGGGMNYASIGNSAGQIAGALMGQPYQPTGGYGYGGGGGYGGYTGGYNPYGPYGAAAPTGPTWWQQVFGGAQPASAAPAKSPYY